jgi:hypothetical protein
MPEVPCPAPVTEIGLYRGGAAILIDDRFGGVRGFLATLVTFLPAWVTSLWFGG